MPVVNADRSESLLRNSPLSSSNCSPAYLSGENRTRPKEVSDQSLAWRTGSRDRFRKHRSTGVNQIQAGDPILLYGVASVNSVPRRLARSAALRIR